MTVPNIKITGKHWADAVQQLDGYSNLAICNKAIEIALAEQSAEQYITAEEARKLGAGKAEWFDDAFNQWSLCTPDICNYHPYFKYRAIKRPEPVQPTCQVQNLDTGELKTMTREAAKKLQAETKDVCYWFNTFGDKADFYNYTFDHDGIYTYKLRGTVKLTIGDSPAQILTPAQCEAERLARIDTHDLQRKGWSYRWFDSCVESAEGFIESNASWGVEYRLIRKQPKQVSWTGSRDDVIALLNELGFKCSEVLK